MALGMGHERNGVSDETKKLKERIRALRSALRQWHEFQERIRALRSALRQWHEFQCGTGITWEQCDPCQSMMHDGV